MQFFIRENMTEASFPDRYAHNFKLPVYDIDLTHVTVISTEHGFTCIWIIVLYLSNICQRFEIVNLTKYLAQRRIPSNLMSMTFIFIYLLLLAYLK